MLLIADSTILVNFLKIDRMNLIGSHHPRCAVTEDVVGEITYLDQSARLQAAFRDGHLDVITVDNPVEIELFVKLSEDERLGLGERSSIAVALNRRYLLGMDDGLAARRAKAFAAAEGKSPLSIKGTRDIIVRLIRAGDLSVAQADIHLVEWRSKHRFNLPIKSFAEVVNDPSCG